jgi:Effector Associated Constant Component 1
VIGERDGWGEGVDLRLTVTAETGEEPGEVAWWAVQLLQQLSDLDGVTVEPGRMVATPAAKGLGATAQALLAHVARAGALAALVRAVREWASRTNRSVEISLDGDVLKLTGASREQQQLVVEAFIARHPVA